MIPAAFVPVVSHLWQLTIFAAGSDDGTLLAIRCWGQMAAIFAHELCLVRRPEGTFVNSAHRNSLPHKSGSGGDSGTVSRPDRPNSSIAGTLYPFDLPCFLRLP